MKTLLKALAISLVAAWIYSPCLHGTWLWDDDLEITGNAALRSAGGWWTPWVHPAGMDYFPLKSSVQWIEWHIWGANPFGYHVANLGLHIASALLVWRLLHLLGLRAAYLGGLLFAVHPLAVESVAWVSEFKNTLSLPPLLLASIAWVQFDRDGRRRDAVIALAWFVAALACKTSVVMFPCVLVLFAWWRRGRLAGRDLLEAAPFFGASLAMGIATLWFQSTRAIGVSAPQAELGSRVAEAGLSIASYARQSLWPVGLEPIYAPARGAVPAFVPWVGIAGLLLFFWARRAGWGRHAVLGSGWFLLNLVPVLGIAPMAYMRVAPRADHLAYVSLVGVVGLAAGFAGAAGAWRARPASRAARRILLSAVAVAALAAMAATARSYAAAFHDEKALWTLAVERNPGAWLAQANLGRELFAEGRSDKAVPVLREAVRLRPDSAETHTILGKALGSLGQPASARAEFAAALAADPGFWRAHYALGLSYIQSGLYGDAAPEFQAVLMLNPADREAMNNLGLCLAHTGHAAEAMAEYRLALESDPQLAEAHVNLGNALFRLGRFDEAVAEYRAALRSDPGYSGAHANLAEALRALGRQEEAERELGEAQRTANH